MKHIYIILLALLMCACGADDYRAEARALTPITHVNGYSPTDPSWVGLCVVKNGKRAIYIYDWLWLAETEEQREITIYHERGHCDADQKHNDTLLADGCPASLMHWQVPTIACADKHIGDYRLEFQQGWQ